MWDDFEDFEDVEDFDTEEALVSGWEAEAESRAVLFHFARFAEDEDEE